MPSQLPNAHTMPGTTGDAVDPTVSMCVVYPRNTGKFSFPEDAVAAFKEWDEAEAYQVLHYPDGMIINQVIAGEERELYYRMVDEQGHLERITDFCRFCGRLADEVEALVKADRSAICAACVKLCQQTIDQNSGSEA